MLRKLIRITILWGICMAVIFACSEEEMAKAGVFILPQSTKIIEDEAFAGVVCADTVIIPEGTLSIGSRAFANCDMYSISLPESLRTIADDAFEGCENTRFDTVKGSYAEEWVQTHMFSDTLIKINHMEAYVGGGNLFIEVDLEVENLPFTYEYVVTDNDRVIASSSGSASYLSGFQRTFGGGLGAVHEVRLKITDALGFSKEAFCTFVSPLGLTIDYMLSGNTHTVYHVYYNLLDDDTVEIVGGSGLPFIPDYVEGLPVSRIGKRAFKASDFRGEVVDLWIPNTVVSIAEYAFYNSGFKGQLYLPYNLRSIGAFAFARCSQLNGPLYLPEGLISIGNGAFMECSGFEGGLVLPPDLQMLGHSAFGGCSGFSGSLYIPDTLPSIGKLTFSGCTGLDGVLHIGNNVTSIGEQAFSACTNLFGPLTIPDSVTEIQKSAFLRCSGFESLTLGSNLETIGDVAFQACTGLKGNLVIPNLVKSLGTGAFSQCFGLNGNLIIGNSITEIADETFSDCQFTNVRIPPKVKSISSTAFTAGFLRRMTIYGELHTYAATFASENNLTFRRGTPS